MQAAMSAVTGIILAAFGAFTLAWYTGAVEGNFSLLLLLATVVTGAYWVADKLVFQPQRRRAAEQLVEEHDRRKAALAQQGFSQIEGDIEPMFTFVTETLGEPWDLDRWLPRPCGGLWSAKHPFMPSSAEWTRVLWSLQLQTNSTMAQIHSNPDNKCPWCLGDPLMEAYHDREWGVPVHDDRVLFEFLNLEGAQAIGELVKVAGEDQFIGASLFQQQLQARAHLVHFTLHVFGSCDKRRCVWGTAIHLVSMTPLIPIA